MYIRAFVAMVLGVAVAQVGFGQQYPPTPPPYPQAPPQSQTQPQQPYPQYPQGQAQYPPAQGYPPQQYPTAGQPPMLGPQQLDQLVASIALYPDGLLAHVLTAATFPQQVPEAAGWANQHAYLHGEALAQAIREDNLPWDVSVLSLLPFPQVLSQMAQYMQWTAQLGDAVLAQRGDVMDAIQRLRGKASQEGYLQDPQFTRYERVEMAGPGDIQIVPMGPDYYVPYYNPQIFFVAPRRGFYGAFSFGPAVNIGGFFGGFGWGGGVGFGWSNHAILVGGGNPWNRGWRDRTVVRQGFVPNRRVEQHGWAPEHRGGEEHHEARHDERGHEHH